MKKSLFILISVILFSFMACSKSDEVNQPVTDNLKHSWVFTVTTVHSVDPSMAGYPTFETATIEQSNLTSTEADQVIKDMSTTTVIVSGTMTFTTSITVKKAVKK